MHIDQSALQVKEHESREYHLVYICERLFITENGRCWYTLSRLFERLHLVQITHYLQIGNHLKSFRLQLTMETIVAILPILDRSNELRPLSRLLAIFLRKLLLGLGQSLLVA